MNISKNTLAILKNFSNINTGIQFIPGNVLKTISNKGNIFAKCIVAEQFPVDFSIYDLHKFLSVLSLDKTNEIELEFDNKNVIVYSLNRRSKIYYRGCLSSMIIVPPAKEISMPSEDISFTLSESDFKWILNTAAVLGNPNISVTSTGNNVTILVNNSQDDSAHVQELKLDVDTEHSFNFIFKTENLVKLLLGSYEVKLSQKGIAYFKNCSGIDLEYFVTVETGSSFGGK